MTINLTYPLLTLSIIFIVLKLCKVIAWSWWLVLMPLYLPYALFLFIFVLAFVIGSLSLLVARFL